MAKKLQLLMQKKKKYPNAHILDHMKAVKHPDAMGPYHYNDYNR